MTTSLHTKTIYKFLQACSLIIMLIFTGCSTAYKAAPVSFKSPSTLVNCVDIDRAKIGVKAYDNKDEAASAFGFDIIGSGILPVQVVFDNQSIHLFEINGSQSFLKDKNGNLWPVLSRKMAYDRAAQNTQTDQILKKGTSSGLMGATAGAIIGSAIGIVSGTNVGKAAAKGAAVGGSIGLITGGINGHQDKDAHRSISQDLKEKSLENKTILPETLSYGILFYPAEAGTPENLQLLLLETDTSRTHRLMFNLTKNNQKP